MYLCHLLLNVLLLNLSYSYRGVKTMDCKSHKVYIKIIHFMCALLKPKFKGKEMWLAVLLCWWHYIVRHCIFRILRIFFLLLLSLASLLLLAFPVVEGPAVSDFVLLRLPSAVAGGHRSCALQLFAYLPLLVYMLYLSFYPFFAGNLPC